MRASETSTSLPQPTLGRRLTDRPKNCLLFTSAGDRANLMRWLDGPRDFDLCIAYYGDTPGTYADTGEYYFERKGSKFGNLKYAHETWPELLAPYQWVLIQDDDLLISAEDLNRLFAMHAEEDLWVSQSAFNPIGKVSWPITQVHRSCRLRYTNFVEMTAPLFCKDKLINFLDEFDPVLTGTGTDWWYMQSLGSDIEGKVAVIDEITCVNPHNRMKGGQRECNRLEDEASRQAAWQLVKANYGIARRTNEEFGRQAKPLPDRWISPLIHFPVVCYATARRLYGKLKRAFR